MEEFSLFSSNSSNTPTISYISSNWKRGVVDKENKVRESLAYYMDLSMTKLVGICQRFSKFVFPLLPFLNNCSEIPLLTTAKIERTNQQFYTNHKTKIFNVMYLTNCRNIPTIRTSF